MAPLKIKIEGRGNGIKTILTNISTIAKDIRHTKPSYLTKYFGIEVAASSKYDTKKNVGIIKGKHERKQLQSILNKFIKQFVLCPECDGHGLKISQVNHKKNILKQKCAACGWIDKNTSNHKIKSYIIKDVEKHKKNRKKNKKTDRKKKRRQQMNSSSKNKEDISDNDENILKWYGDDTWSIDIDDNAVLERRQQEMNNLSAKNEVNILVENDEKKEMKCDDSPKQILRNFIHSAERSDMEILDEIKRISLAQKLDQKKTIQFCVVVLCKLDGLNGFIESVKRYKVIWKTFTANAIDVQVFFGVLEEVICRETCAEFLENVYKIFECLYGEEIVSKDDILFWADLSTDKAIIIDENESELIRNNAAMFIKMLRESDGKNNNEKQS
eukprot:1009759_1